MTSRTGLPSAAPTGVQPNVPVVMDALVNALDPVTIPKFATTLARDTAYSGFTTGEKAGARCWITNREGVSYFSPTGSKWEWESVNRVLFFNTRATAADVTTSGPIILCPAITLPPGNRLIEITASTVMLNLGATKTQGRAYVGNLADGDNYIQLPLDPGDQGSNGRTWLVIASGTVDYDLNGLSTVSSNAVRFTSSWLQVLDRGPCDG